ncbi:PadR family transcriptional regulator [Caenibacillus caldisaponilyticus]|uniref:PadR family transcriptional regulator n=1 Tax=Caenibacillus caldisaponilyticus TaxID=1674942 RepID=UPI0009883578|nr:PadR family transcriptional regulator [Caenibacillus caldisaponilyticus]
MALKSQLLKGVLEGCILAVIAREEVYGYELSVKLAEYGLTFVSEGSIYPVLLRMQKEQLISGILRDSPNGPKRKYYRLTEKGHQALEEFKENWMDMKAAVERILNQGSGEDDGRRND